WCDINLGVASREAGRLASAMLRMAELPELLAAFRSGALSIDKVLLVAPIATPATDARFTEIATTATLAQLQRICAAYRRLDDDDEPDEHEARRARRQVTSARLDSGLVRIVALLEPDEAAVVLAALDARVEDAWRRDGDGSPRVELAARRADAL